MTLAGGGPEAALFGRHFRIVRPRTAMPSNYCPPRETATRSSLHCSERQTGMTESFDRELRDQSLAGYLVFSVGQARGCG